MPASKSAPPLIELRNVTKIFPTPKGGEYIAIHELSLCVQPGEFCAVVGPTGCGKSTTLGLISGLSKPSAGEALVRGLPVTGITPRVGYVFQGDAVFPWKTVLDNVAAGLLFRHVSKNEAFDRARDWVNRVGLRGFETYFPHQLSGGMRKRVALAQTFICEPDILLMDEPFSSLDVHTRTLMEEELLELWAASKACVVFVTHDLEEAIALADKVCVLTAGPATVKGVYMIDIPRPRHLTEVRFHPRFSELHHEIWQDLKDEVILSYERSKKHG